jgi:hypothetical protein
MLNVKVPAYRRQANAKPILNFKGKTKKNGKRNTGLTRYLAFSFILIPSFQHSIILESSFWTLTFI